MSLELQITALAYLGLTALLSMIIGIDRQRTEKPAGLRTHMLARIGACLFTMVGAMAFPNGDATRIASTVVTGIGFLGAGTIWHDNDTVKSLTTAASIWATAAVGVAVGAGVGDGVGVEVGSDGVAVGAEVGMGVGVMVVIGSLRGGKVGRGSQGPDGLLPGDGIPEETAGMGADAAPAT